MEEVKELEGFFKRAKHGFKTTSKFKLIKDLFFKIENSSKLNRFIILLQLLKITSKCNYKSLSSFIYDKKYSDNEGHRMRNVFEYTMNHFEKEITLDSIAEVANMDDLVFEGNIDESDVGQLKKGMKLELTVGAIEKTKFEATLDFIAPKGVVESGSVKFEIIANVQQQKDIFLRAGYSASADIILEQKKQVLAIMERDLLFEEDGRCYVETGTIETGFKKAYVKIGLSDGIQIEILEGIDLKTSIKVQGKTL